MNLPDMSRQLLLPGGPLDAVARVRPVRVPVNGGHAGPEEEQP